MVGEDRPAASASRVWDQPKCALAAAVEAGYHGLIGSVNREARDALKELGAIRATPGSNYQPAGNASALAAGRSIGRPPGVWGAFRYLAFRSNRQRGL
jgi:hypothetical protein